MKLDPDALEKAARAICVARGECDGSCLSCRELLFARASILAYLTAREAQGWAERPREPTEAMVSDGGEVEIERACYNGDNCTNRVYHESAQVWRAMWDAFKADGDAR